MDEINIKTRDPLKTKTEIVSVPNNEPEYLFNLSKETKSAKRNLYILSVVGILSAGFGISINSFFNIQLEGGVEHLNFVLFLLSFFSLCSFIVLYLRDVQYHQIMGIQHELDIDIKIDKKGYEERLKCGEVFGLLRFLKLEKFIEEAVSLLESKFSEETKRTLELDTSFHFESDELAESRLQEGYPHVFQIKNDSDRMSEVVKTYLRDISGHAEANRVKAQHKIEYNLESTNKWIVFILIDGTLPVSLAILALISLYNKTDIERSICVFFNDMSVIQYVAFGALSLGFLTITLFILSRQFHEQGWPNQKVYKKKWKDRRYY